MKQNVMFLFPVGLLLLAGCSKLNSLQEVQSTGLEEYGGQAFHAEYPTEVASTRAMAIANGWGKWDGHETFCVNGPNYNSRTVVSNDGRYVDFKINGLEKSAHYNALYPGTWVTRRFQYNENTGEYTIYFPSTQPWKDNSSFYSSIYPAVARSIGSDLSFHRVCGILKLTMQGASPISNVGLARFVTVGADDYISGIATVSPQDSTLIIASAAGSKQMDVIFPSAKTINDSITTIYLILPIGTYDGGCKLQLYDKTAKTKLLSEAVVSSEPVVIWRGAITHLKTVSMPSTPVIPKVAHHVNAGKGDMRIYLDGIAGNDNAMLKLTNKPTNKGLYFKFGSVVGIAPGNNNDMFDAGDVLYNPSYNHAAEGKPYTITKWGSSGDYGTPTHIADGYVPSYNRDDYNAVDGPYNVSDNDKYHTVANIKVGKGDPCKLVGYTLGQIRTMLRYGQLPDNGKYRLPGNSHNGTFGSIYGGFTRGGMTFTADAAFLPATGYRKYNGGETYLQGSYGGYWSNTAYGAVSAHYLGFYGSTVGAQDPNYYSYGFSVRCIAADEEEA